MESELQRYTVRGWCTFAFIAEEPLSGSYVQLWKLHEMVKCFFFYLYWDRIPVKEMWHWYIWQQSIIFSYRLFLLTCYKLYLNMSFGVTYFNVVGLEEASFLWLEILLLYGKAHMDRLHNTFFSSSILWPSYRAMCIVLHCRRHAVCYDISGMEIFSINV